MCVIKSLSLSFALFFLSLSRNDAPMPVRTWKRNLFWIEPKWKTLWTESTRVVKKIQLPFFVWCDASWCTFIRWHALNASAHELNRDLTRKKWAERTKKNECKCWTMCTWGVMVCKCVYKLILCHWILSEHRELFAVAQLKCISPMCVWRESRNEQ